MYYSNWGYWKNFEFPKEYHQSKFKCGKYGKKWWRKVNNTCANKSSRERHERKCGPQRCEKCCFDFEKYSLLSTHRWYFSVKLKNIDVMNYSKCASQIENLSKFREKFLPFFAAVWNPWPIEVFLSGSHEDCETNVSSVGCHQTTCRVNQCLFYNSNFLKETE